MAKYENLEMLEIHRKLSISKALIVNSYQY